MLLGILKFIINYGNNFFEYNGYLLGILKLWSIFELINWFVYLYIYLKIINPRLVYYQDKDTEKIIKRIDKLSKKEIEYIIKGCITYDKIEHKEIDYINFDIKTMNRMEMINLLAYALYGIDQKNITKSEQYNEIVGLIEKIEIRLRHRFINGDKDRYIYRYWGRNFINFN